ncbi:MAG: hypothetical protein LBU08_02405 [Tannerellaceae bacterium]|jgi:hypothetical protein|nr:hypothetical protein [Tannerellaceae bacterium]
MHQSSREYLSKFFFELAKFSFIALTLAGLFALFTQPVLKLEIIWMILVGLLMTVIFGYIGYKFSKTGGQ